MLSFVTQSHQKLMTMGLLFQGSSTCKESGKTGCRYPDRCMVQTDHYGVECFTREELSRAIDRLSATTQEIKNNG